MSKLEQLIEELCPDGVECKSVDEMFDIKNGYTPSKANADFWENGSIPWFRMEDIRINGRMLFDAVQHVTPEAVKGKLLPANSLIMSTTATIGEHALINTEALTNQQITAFSLKNSFIDNVEVKFLFYCFFSFGVWCKENANKSGGMYIIGIQKMKQYSIPLPPLPIQRKIVRILDNFTELTAELTKELTAELAVRKKQYEYYRDELLSFGDAVPMVSLGEISISTSTGVTPLAGKPEYYEGGNIPWLRTQEVRFVDIWNTNMKITEKALRETSLKWVPENCVIMAISGATAGRAGINKIPLTTNQHCCCFEIDKNKALYKYVFHCIANANEDLLRLKQGARGDLNTGLIKRFSIPIPPLAEQARIVDILDKFDALTTDITASLPAEIEARRKQYEYYRDKLLTFKEVGS